MRPSCLLAFALLFAASALPAQVKLECLKPGTMDAGDCTITGTTGAPSLLFLRASLDGKPWGGATVSVDSSPRDGALTLPSKTSAGGIVSVLWDGSTIDGDVTWAVRVHGGADGNHHSVSRTVTIRKPAPAPKLGDSNWDDDLSQARTAVGFAGTQVARPLKIDIDNVANPTSCGRQVVTFTVPDKGSVSPATAAGEWTNGRCLVEARWTLGGTVGSHSLTAQLKDRPETTRRFQAVGRALPRLVVGLAAASRTEFTRLDVQEDTTVLETETFSPFSAVLGLDTPLYTKWPAIRGFLGASAANLDREWYVGLSLLHLVKVFRPHSWAELEAETLPVSLHLVTRIDRITKVTNAEDCELDVSTCVEDTSLEFGGYGVVVAVNTMSLLETITKGLSN